VPRPRRSRRWRACSGTLTGGRGREA